MAGTFTAEQQAIKLLAAKQDKQQIDFANQQSLIYVSLLSKLSKGEISQKTFLDQSNVVHDSLDNYASDTFTKTFFQGIKNGLPTVSFPDQTHRDSVVAGYSELTTFLAKNPSATKDAFQAFSENIVNDLVSPNASAPSNIVYLKQSGKTSLANTPHFTWIIALLILLPVGFIIYKIITKKGIQ